MNPKAVHPIAEAWADLDVRRFRARWDNILVFTAPLWLPMAVVAKLLLRRPALPAPSLPPHPAPVVYRSI